MDLESERKRHTLKVPGKRTWSPGFPAHSRDGVDHATPTAGRLQSGEHHDGSDPKRPRLLTIAPSRPQTQPEPNSSRAKPALGSLPNEIQQHIFSFLDPISLGRIIRVNRSFRSLIDPAASLPEASGQARQLTLRSQDLVWATSRKTFFQGFPKPMDAMTELEMWRLALGRRCQYCSSRGQPENMSLSTSSPWHAGPGLKNVRTIWPFRVRTCGSCLEPRLVKETDLLVSGSSALLPGLPFAIFTPSLDYVASVVLRQVSIPPDIQLTKYYFKPQLEDLQRSRDGVRALGAAALEEWYKGLEDLGQQQIAAAARFDQWQLNSPFWKTSTPARGNTSQAGFPRASNIIQDERPLQLLPGTRDGLPIPPLAKSAGLLNPGAISHARPAAHLLPPETNVYAVQHGTAQPPAGVDNHTGSSSIQSSPRHRVERSPKEAELCKAERRKEIERRCLAFDPPIMPSTLVHMEAFKAAILISQPLNDNAWDLLRPRLLAQRLEAEQTERMHNASLNYSTIPPEGRRALEEERRVAQENVSHMWLELKVPARDKIQTYAQEFIHQTWSGGRGVTKATASKFAAEVLCHVRQRFDEVIAQEDRMLALKGTGFPQDPESQACRKLKLEDMKWTFEEYVKPHTERFGKDLFLCRVCDTNQKLFSFEAVIQHYAAKHTSALSHGTAVVYWRAPWPIDPPFDPSPNIPWIQEGLRNVEQPAASLRRDVNFGYPASGPHRNLLETVAALALEFWHKLDGIWDLSDAVRLYVVVQHINVMLLRESNVELDLHLFTRAIMQQPELQSIRDLVGLGCRTCSELGKMAAAPFPGRTPSRYSLLELLVHFQQVHLDLEGASAETGATPLSSWAPARADWKRDMIWLPSPAAIQALLHSPGIDRDKLQIIADAFPNYFAQPFHCVGPLPSTLIQGETQVPTAPSARYLERRGPHIARRSGRGSGDGSYIAPTEESGITAEDEYDPHRPAPTFRRSQHHEVRHPMQSPPRESTRHEELPYYPERAPIYRQYYYQNADYDRVWDQHSRDGPLSGASMVWSHDDGSSRFSYLEPLNRNSETTAEGASEAVPGSKAGSRRSLPLAVDTDKAGAGRNLDGQRNIDEEPASTAAANFLEDFDPTRGEIAVRFPSDTGALHTRQAEQIHLGLPHPRPVARHAQEYQAALRPGSRLGDIDPLPIRLNHRPDLRRNSYQRLNKPRPVISEGAGPGTSRSLVAEREYMGSLPERSHRASFQSTNETLDDRGVGLTGSSYETRYYPEDNQYRRSTRRYEAAGSASAELSTRMEHSGPRRYIDSRSWTGGNDDDDDRRQYWHRDTSHEYYGRAFPQGRSGVGAVYGAEHPSAREIDFVGHDVRHARGEQFVPEHRVWTVADDTREVVYKPLDPPMRYAPG
ncbi:hypothetical protein A1O1_05083 [Capronia coronata CBS 617.96]|uniref:F-box domain-containing protein n=1 Tax=Capronia coronata CBS 617.96 TaxID=1182541 RepID=W9YEQ4_9EURO|nr:uncharacterized protein A1O1_05083 [Capronia coronata CBS 617.96]EXJ88155.1 hypothetical protein A1O1_05083 [Capronia coronata CBS 617.96]